ncbi:MAG: hypothetical protein QXL64_07955 [Thermofilaceae archaeon]
MPNELVTGRDYRISAWLLRREKLIQYAQLSYVCAGILDGTPVAAALMASTEGKKVVAHSIPEN